jgi:hypothetical protein
VQVEAVDYHVVWFVRPNAIKPTLTLNAPHLLWRGPLKPSFFCWKLKRRTQEGATFPVFRISQDLET